MKQEEFNSRLKPFDDLYTEMYKGIRKQLEAMTERELNQILIDASSTSNKNCAWSTYAVSPIIREIARNVKGIEVRNAYKATEPHSNVVVEAEEELN